MRLPVYDPEAVRPMWEQLEQVGVKSLTTPGEVEEFLTKRDGTTMVVINSICGCAAGSARPGIMLALQHKTIPDHLCTVFAGQDHDAVEKVRSQMTVPPSSPCVALFEKGRMIFALQRHQIEGTDRDEVAGNLTAAFDKHCSGQGPSCSPEEFAKLDPITACGSSIPRFTR